MLEGDQTPRSQERFEALSVICLQADIHSFNNISSPLNELLINSSSSAVIRE